MGAADTTSSQILLSRGVAGSRSTPISGPEAPIAITSAFESSTKHIMTLGDAACHTLEKCLHNHSLELCTSGSEQHAQHFEGLSLRDFTSSEQTSPTRVVDKGKEVERGRSPERKCRYFNPLARAESKHSRGDNCTIDVDARPIKR